jgi:hypothetical protein
LVNKNQVLARNVEANSFHGGAFCCVLIGRPLSLAACLILADSLFHGPKGLSNSEPARCSASRPATITGGNLSTQRCCLSPGYT